MGAYVAAAIGWSLFKWHMLVQGAKQSWAAHIARFQEGKHTKENHYDREEHIYKTSYYTIEEWATLTCWKVKDSAAMRFRNHLPPRVEDFRGRIVGWMMYWPLSLLWFLLHNPLRSFFRWVFDNIAGWYTHIARRQFDTTIPD